MKEENKIILLESHKIFLSLQFLQTEEEECLTSYGKGLLTGLLDPDTGHKIPVIHRDEYNKLKMELEQREKDIAGLMRQLKHKSKKGVWFK